ncbi:MAG: hypothetical protein M3Y28_00450 [Armatimonadota bacterium]|nr:hypothetical protein [Armatimonadota bacterium]
MGTLTTMNIGKIIGAGLKTGLVLAATTTAAILLVSQKENHSPWAALNCVAHIVDGDEKEQPTDFSPRETGLGLAVNATAMGLWGVLYEGALSITKIRSTPLTAALATAVAYVTDYKLVPKRFTPGIEKRLSQPAILAVYAVLGATLAASSLWNKPVETEN